jgi:formate hydrogenlyase subunit 3/multisubunit Na+/H+ antiporter MnhD subunit
MLSSDDLQRSLTGIRQMKLLFPVLLMLITSGTLWISRKRAMRTQWGLSAAFALIIWIVCLLLRLGSDLDLQASVWQPSELFSTPLALSFDDISWPILYSLVTVLVAMIFTSASRDAASSIGVRIFWFLYSATAVLAILADNLLTVIITWTSFDFLSSLFLFSFLRSEDETRQVLTRLSIDILGVLLIIAGTAIIIASGQDAGLNNPIETTAGVVLLALGSFVRLGLLPLHFNLPALMAVRRGLGTLFRLFPPAIVLAFIARIFRAGVPNESLPWFLIAGLTGVVIGGVRWLLEVDSISGRPFFILLLSGLGVLSTASMPENYTGIVAACVVLLLAGAVISLTVIHTPSHRIFSLGAALVLLGIPVLPGSILSNMASLSGITPGFDYLWRIIILLAMSIATLGCLHLYFVSEVPWKTGESPVRITYSLGLSLPVFTTVGIGIHLRPNVDLWTWILLASQLLLVGLGYIALRNVPEGRISRLRFSVSRFDPSNLYARFGRVMREGLTALRSLADLIEGEAAILWIFAITAFLILASS